MTAQQKKKNRRVTDSHKAKVFTNVAIPFSFNIFYFFAAFEKKKTFLDEKKALTFFSHFNYDRQYFIDNRNSNKIPPAWKLSCSFARIVTSDVSSLNARLGKRNCLPHFFSFYRKNIHAQTINFDYT